MGNKFYNLLNKFLYRDAPTRGKLTEEMYITAMSKVYQNPAFIQYLDEREEYLIREGMEKFINNKIDDTRGLAGQLVEIRALRSRLKVCYNIKHKKS